MGSTFFHKFIAQEFSRYKFSGFQLIFFLFFMLQCIDFMYLFLLSEPFADPCGSKICWLEKDVKLLITLYKELSELLGKTAKCKSKARMFREISKRMAEHGCTYTPIQVEIKWRNLEKKYKKSLQHNQKTGRNRMKIEFER